MERERITISIKASLLALIDKTIDGIKVRNRSHAIETLASKALLINESKNAVILIGGENALKTIPTVENNLKMLSRAGFEKVYVAVGFLGDKIKNKLGDGEKYNLELTYLSDGEGTGGALLPLKKEFSSTFFVFNNAERLNGHSITKLLEFHKKHTSSVTIVTDNLDKLNGLYVLEPDIFDYIPKGFSMLENDIFSKLISEGKIVIYPLI